MWQSIGYHYRFGLLLIEYLEEGNQINYAILSLTTSSDVIIIYITTYLYYIPRHYTERFIMFSVITNIYNKKTKGPILMEFFTATGKLKKVFFDK